jgi:ubiquinone/menaquinone biosynthesis C-methylase UbiE
MCGSAQLSVEKGLRTLQADPEVVLMSCERCYATSVSRLPTPTALDDYYSSYYDTGNVAAVTADDPAKIARRIARYASKSSSIDLLEFGGGDGSIGIEVLARLGARGSVTVVDYDHRRFAPAPSGVILNHTEELCNVQRTFNLVIASAAIEHLPNPKAVLQDLLAKVVLGGGILRSDTVCHADDSRCWTDWHAS